MIARAGNVNVELRDAEERRMYRVAAVFVGKHNLHLSHTSSRLVLARANHGLNLVAFKLTRTAD